MTHCMMESLKNNIFQRSAILVYVVISVLYLTWRIGFTLNKEQMVASLLFVFVDIATCLSAILFVVSLWRKSMPPVLCENTKPFTVDVFVTTYNEDCAMLESTLQHCIVKIKL